METLGYQLHSLTNGVQSNLELKVLTDTSPIIQDMATVSESTTEKHTHEFLSKRHCNGIMGVPITFLDKYNTEQFEIVGMDLNDSVKNLGIKEIGAEWVELYRKQGGKGHITARMHSLVYTHNGKAVSLYRRILIRKKAGA